MPQQTQTPRTRDELNALWSEIEASIPPAGDSDESRRERYVAWGQAREAFYAEHGNIPPPQADLDRLAALKNKHRGERIFILGNGPSLNRTPLEHLKDEYTLGVNRIYLMYDKIDWRPSFYTTVDWRVAPDCRDEINALPQHALENQDTTYFFPERFRGLLREGPDVQWYWHGDPIDGWDGVDPRERRMSHDLTRGCRGAGSVTGSAIQIAFHLGFDHIYLIGVDASYKVLSTVDQQGEDKFDNGVKLHLTSTQDDDPNHFDPRYFGKGRRWHDPNVKRMLQGYEQCRDSIRGTGRQIINATVGGNLETFPRVEFNDLFPRSSAVRVPALPTSSIESKATTDPMSAPPAHQDILFPDVPETDRVAVEELDIVKQLLDTRGVDGAQAVMLDVGAHHGNALCDFADAGWRVHAFEPDENNRAGLMKRLKDTWRVSVDTHAVSDKAGQDVAFFTSPESTGISALAPFVASHKQSQRVSTTTLTDYCAEHAVTRVDLLKTDTEGFDFMALKGFPWDKTKPAVIVCEFEDAKSVPLGYTHAHLADYLRDKGYTVLVSEWRPIVRYGARHSWRRLTRWPTPLAHPEAWGNLIAFLDEPNSTLDTPPTDDEIVEATHAAIRASQAKFIDKQGARIEYLERKGAANPGLPNPKFKVPPIVKLAPEPPRPAPIHTSRAKRLLKRQANFFLGWKGALTAAAALLLTAPAIAAFATTTPIAIAISLLALPIVVVIAAIAIAHTLGGLYEARDAEAPQHQHAAMYAQYAGAVAARALKQANDVGQSMGRALHQADNAVRKGLAAEKAAKQAAEHMKNDRKATKALADRVDQHASDAKRMHEIAETAKRLATEARDSAAGAARSTTQLATRLSEAAQRATEATRAAREASEHARRLDQRLDESTRSTKHTLRDATERAAKLATETKDHLAGAREHHNNTRDALKSVRESLDKRLAGERSDRMLSFANLADRDRPMPKRVVLVACAQRTGSTWLVDALRAHPNIEFEPTCRLATELGVGRSNRYPRALVSADQKGLDVEIMPGRGERVPLLDPGADARALADKLDLPDIAIEKVHPEFINFNAEAFADAIDRYEQAHGASVSIIYRLRDPAESIRSMLSYKTRDPNWYEWLDSEQVPGFMERSYRTLAELAERRPGAISLYESHRLEAPTELARLYTALWPDADTGALTEIARDAERAIERARDERAPANPFFASNTGAPPPVSADDVLARHAETLRVLAAFHQRIVDAKPGA